LIWRQSSFENRAARFWLSCHASVSPHRSSASAAYSSPGRPSPKISRCSAADSWIPCFFALIISSTAATIRCK
jgi:hypothetical protein